MKILLAILLFFVSVTAVASYRDGKYYTQYAIALCAIGTTEQVLKGYIYEKEHAPNIRISHYKMYIQQKNVVMLLPVDNCILTIPGETE